MAMDGKLYFRRGASTGALTATETAGVGNSLPVRGYPNGVARNGMYVVAKLPAAGATDGTKSLTISVLDAADNGSGAPGAFAAVAEGTTMTQTGMVQVPVVLVAKISRSREWLATTNTVTAGGNFGNVAIFLTNEYPQYQ